MIEAGLGRKLGQDLYVANILTFEKIGLEQGFYDALSAAFAAGEMNQPMRAQGVGGTPDALEREFDALGAPRVRDRRIESLS